MTDEEQGGAGSEGNGPEGQQPEQDKDVEGAQAIGDPLEAAKQEAQRYRDQLLRTAADFDNFRKRARRDQVEAERRGREDFLRELLPVFDNLERATSHAGTATDVQSLVDGIQMVLRHFSDTLAKMGINRVPGVGTTFDPALHEAIQHLETTEFPAGTVAAEVQGGYRTADRLIRPALVVVAKEPSNPGKASNGAGDDVDGSGSN